MGVGARGGGGGPPGTVGCSGGWGGGPGGPLGTHDVYPGRPCGEMGLDAVRRYDARTVCDTGGVVEWLGYAKPGEGVRCYVIYVDMERTAGMVYHEMVVIEFDNVPDHNMPPEFGTFKSPNVSTYVSFLPQSMKSYSSSKRKIQHHYDRKKYDGSDIDGCTLYLRLETAVDLGGIGWGVSRDFPKSKYHAKVDVYDKRIHWEQLHTYLKKVADTEYDILSWNCKDFVRYILRMGSPPPSPPRRRRRPSLPQRRGGDTQLVRSSYAGPRQAEGDEVEGGGVREIGIIDDVTEYRDGNQSIANF
eukprot:GHVO01016074.1.p1 GENE.GHVO01016074.1~~GHVO01016074.1.p1  ORF type:complete len:302 (+),score=60.16 GHVO01016074.1:565-1470(+)